MIYIPELSSLCKTSSVEKVYNANMFLDYRLFLVPVPGPSWLRTLKAKLTKHSLTKRSKIISTRWWHRKTR